MILTGKRPILKVVSEILQKKDGDIAWLRSTPHYYYDAYTSKNTHIFVAIVIVLGIFYILYEEYKIVRFIVDYNINNLEYMVENVWYYFN